MAQFYFLSIVFNVIAGLILICGSDFTKAEKLPAENDSDEFNEIKNSNDDGKKSELFSEIPLFENGNFRLVLGVLTVLTGLMKILSVFRNDVPVIGDLIPALASLLAGASMLIEYYLVSSSLENNLPENVNRLFIEGRKYIGYFAIIAGVLHFIFPQVLLL